MHPCQSSLIKQAQQTLEHLEPRTAASVLYKYTCPETGKDFWLESRQTTIKSPFTGKSFTAKPEKSSLSDVGKEIKKDQEDAKGKSKKASDGVSLSYRSVKDPAFRTASFGDYSEALRWASHLIEDDANVEIHWGE